MKLSRNFTLTELTKSGTALRLDLDNSPDRNQTEALVAVCENILQPVRDHYGIPFAPSSGFRCLDLNRRIGSKDTSQHTRGEAVDFEVPSVANGDLAAWIRRHLDFDQLILEFWRPDDPQAGWVHCSYRTQGNRNQVLGIGAGGVSNGLEG